MRQYSRVTFEHRCHISAWLEMNISVYEISKQLKFHPSTIYREIRRNRSSRGYNPVTADTRARARYLKNRKKTKMKGDLKKRVIRLLKRDWSPEQISKRLEIEKRSTVSHECIYSYIRKNVDYFRPHLRRLNRRSGVGRYKQKGLHIHSFQPNINKRPVLANQRLRFGDWERDIMFGDGKTPLLVCVDRKSRLVKIAKAADLKASTINDLTIKLVQDVKFKALTVTSDRGTEFKIPLSEVATYYCDPQAPQQRGTVENTIGLIRQYIKRSGQPELLNKRNIKRIENLLNNRPRKVLDYRTPLEVVNKKFVALAI